MLADTDVLFVFGLDHMVTGQDAGPGEVEALRQFLTREGTCLVLVPTMTSEPRMSCPSATWSTTITVTSWFLASSGSAGTFGP